jgi:adenine-specific DNA-methyltransferase
MKQVVIENPILNSPFEEPRRHFKFSEDGITDEIVESRRVSDAHFTGADEPYDKLKRALRAEIDESAWSALYTDESIPFEKPAHKGKIAVKVINHYGDEVLKVYEV